MEPKKTYSTTICTKDGKKSEKKFTCIEDATVFSEESLYNGTEINGKKISKEEIEDVVIDSERSEEN